MGKGKQKRVGGVGGSGDFWIEAWLPLETPVQVEGDDAPKRHTRAAFKNTDITRVVEIDEKTSGFRLESGEAVPVALAFDELRDRLSNPSLDGDTLDLKDVTGPALDDETRVPALKKDFTDTADKDRRVESSKHVTLHLFVHNNKNGHYVPATINTSNIITGSLSNASDGRRTGLRVIHNNPLHGSEWLYFDMPRKTFMEMLNKAQMAGETELDLRERTRYKRPVPRPHGGLGF